MKLIEQLGIKNSEVKIFELDDVTYKKEELEINDMIVSHLHDENGVNWFDDNAGALLLGIPFRTYQDNVKKVLDDIGSFRGGVAKTLKINKTGRPKRYVTFRVIIMVAAICMSKEAKRIVYLAGDLLNEKYNQVQGYIEPKTNPITVVEGESKLDDLQNQRNDDSELISMLNKRCQLSEQNGDMEALEIFQAAKSRVSDDFNEGTLLISDLVELVKSLKKVKELTPKVKGNKLWDRDYLIPFKKS
jgi:hypothetical protein